jgi:hypothetical protein
MSAATGVSIQSVRESDFSDVFTMNVTARAWYLNCYNTSGLNPMDIQRCRFTRLRWRFTTAAGTNTHGIVFDASPNDGANVSYNHFYQCGGVTDLGHGLYAGWSDNNTFQDFYSAPTPSAGGRSIYLHGACDNTFNNCSTTLGTIELRNGGPYNSVGNYFDNINIGNGGDIILDSLVDSGCTYSWYGDRSFNRSWEGYMPTITSIGGTLGVSTLVDFRWTMTRGTIHFTGSFKVAIGTGTTGFTVTLPYQCKTHTNMQGINITGGTSLVSYSAAGSYGVNMYGTVVDTDVYSVSGSYETTYGQTLHPPYLLTITPSNGTHLGGTSVTISGVHMSNVLAVDFGGTNAPTLSANTVDSITCVTPAHAVGVVSVLVATSEGTSPAPLSYTFT